MTRSWIKEISWRSTRSGFLPREILYLSIFSGDKSEKKKNEVLQLKLLKPKFIILDELDSGLDVDSLDLVCKNVLAYQKESNCSILLITHYNRILEKIKPDFVHVLMDGKIVKTGDYSLADSIEKSGYKSSSSLVSEE